MCIINGKSAPQKEIAHENRVQVLRHFKEYLTGSFLKSDNDIFYVLVIIIYFRRFAELFLIINMEAETISELLFTG